MLATANKHNDMLLNTSTLPKYESIVAKKEKTITLRREAIYFLATPKDLAPPLSVKLDLI